MLVLLLANVFLRLPRRKSRCATFAHITAILSVVRRGFARRSRWTHATQVLKMRDEARYMYSMVASTAESISFPISVSL